MQEREAGASPQILARIGGVLYLIVIAGGVFGEAFIRNGLIVPGDATATAANIRSSESLWRVGVASELGMLTCALALGVIFFILLRPVSRMLALLALLFNVVSITIEAVNELQLVAALLPLGSAEYLAAFAPQQLHAMVALSLKTYSYGFGVGLIFFGWACIVLGYLIFRSGYLPKTIGVLMQLAGVSYLINSFALLVAPKLAAQLFPAILVPALIGEASLCLWLLVKGVNVARWNAYASS